MLLIKILAVVICILGSIGLFVVIDFLASYSVEKPQINKGVCPQCGRKLKFSRYMDAKTLAYNCIGDDHIHIAIVSNPYLKWKYCKGRKED